MLAHFAASTNRVLNFGYDALHRLIQSDLDELPFNYDLLGNPSGTGYVTNVLNQLLESPSYVYQYDLRGNLIQQTSKLTSKVMDFTWSVDNKLMQVEIKNNGTDVSGRVSFGYDALGRRISKTWQDLISPVNSHAKTFIYDREDLVMELQEGKVKAFYVHAPGIDNPVAILRDMNNNNEFDDEEVFFYTKDHLGSIRELVGLDGKLKQRQRYTAYGVTTREKNTDQMDRLIDHAYGFTGRELDSEIGLYFYRARFYDSSTGRFMTKDPIGIAGGDFNLYRYVFNSPLRNTDPYGLSVGPELAVGAILLGILTYKVYKMTESNNDAEKAAGALDAAQPPNTVNTTNYIFNEAIIQGEKNQSTAEEGKTDEQYRQEGYQSLEEELGACP